MQIHHAEQNGGSGSSRAVAHGFGAAASLGESAGLSTVSQRCSEVPLSPGRGMRAGRGLGAEPGPSGSTRPAIWKGPDQGLEEGAELNSRVTDLAEAPVGAEVTREAVTLSGRPRASTWTGLVKPSSRVIVTA